jgi:hypothetical protein
MNNDIPADLEQYHDSHGLTLPDWGAYSPYYAGISHIADNSIGLLFDMPVSLGYCSRQGIMPDARFPKDHYSWEAKKTLNYYSYRYEIEKK